ncbi:hypothetical protein [Edaphobacter aggregans]|nr:hypothetical protein [Edaphobacter aggregans]
MRYEGTLLLLVGTLPLIVALLERAHRSERFAVIGKSTEREGELRLGW